MNTIVLHEPQSRRRRRTHSPEFKAKLIAACRQPGVSMASVALAHQLNANLLRKWVNDYERKQSQTGLPQPAGISPLEEPVSLPTFVPVAVQPTAPEQSEPIRIELIRGQTQIKVSWPVSQAEMCLHVLRELMR